jgi:hypothetical protein
MITESEKISNHLRGFTAVRAPLSAVVAAMESSLMRWGPVQITKPSSLAEALEYLLPLKSFTTRFLVIEFGNWSLLLTDMRGENAYVDGMAVSEKLNCLGFGIFAQEERREIQVIKYGRKIRHVQSLLDSDRWYYREEGELQEFEDATDCQHRNKRDRLSVPVVGRYYQRFTGMSLPTWGSLNANSFVGLERSVHELRVPLVRFETVDDISLQK